MATSSLTIALRRQGLFPYFQLVRPANLVTANADVLAGFAAAGLKNPAALPLLMIATTALYGGGVVLNDVFDAQLDAVERPERPLPSGRATLVNAAGLGVSLLAVGIATAAYASPVSGLLAIMIAVTAVLYDSWGKHQSFLGPINMGLCRGLNLLLGASAAGLSGLPWYLGLIPVAYIGAITAVSRGEVHGGSRATGLFALALMGGVLCSLELLGLVRGYRALIALPFAAFLAWRVLPAFWAAYQAPAPAVIRRAIKLADRKGKVTIVHFWTFG